MRHTFNNGDHILVTNFHNGPVELNGVYVFEHDNQTFIKRCVALPGDTIQLKNWAVFVNAKKTIAPGTAILTYKSASPNAPGANLPFDLVVFRHFRRYWSGSDFGPYVVPKKGRMIKLNKANLDLYHDILEKEKFRPNSFVDPETTYTFKNDYYFMVGDNRPGSNDSRMYGAIAASEIRGKVQFRLF
jgi:signal peptidase I